MTDGMAAIRAMVGKKNNAAGTVARKLGPNPGAAVRGADSRSRAKEAAIKSRLASASANDNDADDQPVGGS